MSGEGGALIPHQRLSAYAVAIRGDEVLLVQASSASCWPGTWWLPGGGVEHGEHPEETVVREVMEETGMDIRVAAGPKVFSDVMEIPARGELLHSTRLCYRAHIVAGALREEPHGSSAHPTWHPIAALPHLRTLAFLPQAVAALGGQG